MKKLLISLLLVSIFAGMAMAGSVQTTRGLVYLPAKQSGTQITGTTASTIWTDSTYLAPYTNRTFVVRSLAGSQGCFDVVVQGSADGTYFANVDATMTDVLTSEVRMIRVENNPLPYWRVRATMNGASEYATPEAWAAMSTN